MRALTCVAVSLAGCVSRGRAHAVGWQAQVRPATAATRSPAFDHSPAELDQIVAERTDGFLPEGAAISGRLEAFQPVPVSLERGRCYTMVFRLAPDARFSERALAGVALVYQRSDHEGEAHGRPGIHGPGGVASGGCPLTSGRAVFDVRADLGSATDPSRVHELGVGGYTLQLYSRANSDAQLTWQAADRSVQVADARALAERDRQRQVESARRACAECVRTYTECMGDARGVTTLRACAVARWTCASRAAGLPAAEPCR